MPAAAPRGVLCRCRRHRQVVPDLGLCVTLYEILEVEGGAVYAGEGAALFTVKFSMARTLHRVTARASGITCAVLGLGSCDDSQARGSRRLRGAGVLPPVRGRDSHRPHQERRHVRAAGAGASSTSMPLNCNLRAWGPLACTVAVARLLRRRVCAQGEPEQPV